MSVTATMIQGTLVAILLYTSWIVIRPYIINNPILDLPGPPSTSFIAGILPQLGNRQPWKYLDALLQEYGQVFAIPAMFGETWIHVNDPKAFHNIFVKEQDIYHEDAIMLAMMLGPGLLCTAGDQHRRQRKILNPVFSIKHLRNMMPVFYQVIHKTRDAVASRVRAASATPGDAVELDMLGWSGRTTLEILGQAGLGHSFDPLTEDCADEFAHAVKDLFPEMTRTGLPGMLVRYAKWFGPPAFRRRILERVPSRNVQRLIEIADVLHSRSVLIFNEKKAALQQGDEALKHQIGEGHDIMSVLLRQNMLAAEEDKLPDNELIAQVSTMILAGMDTTANALACVLELLAEHQDVQDKLRREIVDAVDTHGGDHAMDFDKLMALPYLEAVCRETLRAHPGVTSQVRRATSATVLPLSEPIRLRDGTLTSSIPIPKNTRILANLRACNRDKSLWGPDADQWRPERWLEPLPRAVEEARVPGVYSHLMTFIGGSKACIGFKFAQVEMKAVLLVLLQHFKFTPTGKDIRWNAAAVQYPSVGMGHPELPLMVSMLRP